MFKLVHFFIKETFISFYREKGVFYVQKQLVKNKNILEQKNEKFEQEEDFISFLKMALIENTQTYISTIIDTFNQGCVDSCNHSKYKELGININNIKILCLKDYSIFIGLYELNNYKKEMEKYFVDYIFSPYLLIDINKQNTENSLYFLLTTRFIAIVIYEDGKRPKYSNIYQFKNEDETNDDLMKEEEHNDSIDEDIDSIDDDLGDIDLVDDIEELDDLDNLDDTIDDIDDITEDESGEIQEDMKDIKYEIESIEFIKNSIKDYYETYSDNFLEKVYLFYEEEVSSKFMNSLKEELLLEIITQKVDILTLINKLALKELNV